MALKRAAYTNMELDYWNGIGTGIVGTIGYVVLPTGVSTDVSRDIVWRPDKGRTTTTFQLVTETIWSWELSPNPGCSHTNWDSNSYNAQHVESDYFVVGTQNSTSTSTRDREGRTLLAIKNLRHVPQWEGCVAFLLFVVTPAGASLTMYREIRSYANSIWDDNNNNNNGIINSNLGST